MTSIIIAAHNEEAVIGGCLDALADGSADLEIVVSANGCTDATARIAREHGALVVDRPEPGKAGALNAGEALARSFPRIYLDADIIVPTGGVDALVSALRGEAAPLAVVPSRRIETGGRPWPVRAYFAINGRLPAFGNGLFGRGMIALSAQGRARFDAFPALIADDLFLDSRFDDGEKVEVPGVRVVVEAPASTRELLTRLERVRRGNAQLRAVSEGEAEAGASRAVRPSDRWAWLRVVARNPRLCAAGAMYAVLTIIAAVRARRARGGVSWARSSGAGR